MPSIGKTGRTTNDIKPKIFGGAVLDQKNSSDFLSVMEVAEINNRFASKAGHGYWNDPDMLVVGDNHLSFEEQKAHFALWCIMTAPLMLSNDLRNMSDQLKEIILNKEAIAVDQDPLEQGKRIVKNGVAEVWAKHLSDNSMAVLLLNRDKNRDTTISVPVKELGIRSKFSIYDIYQKKSLGIFDASLSAVIKLQSGLFIKITSENLNSRYWDTQRKGTNIFNENMNNQIWQEAANANIKLVRPAPDKWHEKKRDFLIGNADN
jgi:alpha-galactosidase